MGGWKTTFEYVGGKNLGILGSGERELFHCSKVRTTQRSGTLVAKGRGTKSNNNKKLLVGTEHLAAVSA